MSASATASDVGPATVASPMKPTKSVRAWNIPCLPESVTNAPRNATDAQ
jgi:hypothetical protein